MVKFATKIPVRRYDGMDLTYFLNADNTKFLRDEGVRGVYVIKQKQVHGACGPQGKNKERCYRIGSAGGGKMAFREKKLNGGDKLHTSSLHNRQRFYLNNWITDLVLSLILFLLRGWILFS